MKLSFPIIQLFEWCECIEKICTDIKISDLNMPMISLCMQYIGNIPSRLSSDSEENASNSRRNVSLLLIVDCRSLRNYCMELVNNL